MGLPRRWLPTIKASLIASVSQPDHDTYPAAAPFVVFRFPPPPLTLPSWVPLLAGCSFAGGFGGTRGGTTSIAGGARTAAGER